MEKNNYRQTSGTNAFIYRDRCIRSLDDSGYEKPRHMAMVGIAGAALIITIAILITRFGHSRYPYRDIPEGSDSPVK